MADVSGFDPNTPSGTSQILDGDDKIRSIQSDLKAVWEEEHWFQDGSAVSGGEHKHDALESAFRGFKVALTSDAGVPDNTNTRLSWETALFDRGGFVNFSASSQTVTVPSGLDGIYAVQCAAQKTGDGTLILSDTSRFEAEIEVNQLRQSHDRLSDISTSAVDMNLQAAQIINLSAGDELSVLILQDTGSTLTLEGSSRRATWLAAHKIG